VIIRFSRSRCERARLIAMKRRSTGDRLRLISLVAFAPA
jgi:hypothetical protein